MTTTNDNHPTTDNEWLPTLCPTWCDRTHAEALAACGDWQAAQEHFGGGYGGVLSQLRNPIDNRVTRTAAGGWDLDIRQTPAPPPSSGYLTEAVVDLTVHSAFDDDSAARTRRTLPLTSGEARTMARQLVAMADRIDLAAS